MAMNETYDLSVFPLEVALLDDTSVVLRPMTPQDESALLAFFRALPEEERYFMKEDASNPAIVRRWVQEMDYGRALPLLALAGDAVVADTVLVRSRSLSRRRVGELRVQVHPDYRSYGLGTVMMRRLMTLARGAGVEALIFEAVQGKEDEAIRTAQWLGFAEVGRLARTAADPQDRRYDIIIMEALLGSWFEWWPFRVALSQVQVRLPW